MDSASAEVTEPCDVSKPTSAACIKRNNPRMPNELIPRIGEILRDVVLTVEPVRQGTWSRPNIWSVITASGRKVAVKRVENRFPQTFGEKDALETEWEMLCLLTEMGCAVPRPVAMDAERDLLLTEWVEGTTFDDLCQTAPAETPPLVPAGLFALSRIERAMDGRIAEVEPFAFRQDYDAYLGDDFRAYLQEARETFAAFGARTGLPSSEWERAWDDLGGTIFDAAPTMGTLDYNARNLLFHDSEPIVLDFSTVGWDWPERRVAQYFVSLGARRPDGNFATPLSRRTLFASRDALFFSLEALDAHLFVFFCLILSRLIHSLEQGGNTDGWENRSERLRRCLELLGGQGVTDYRPVRFLREQARRIGRELLNS